MTPRRRPTRVRLAALVAVATLLAAGCTSSATGGPDGATTKPTSRKAATEPPGTGACDDVDPAACLLPWPNDRFTRADATTATGRRVDLPKAGMPANRQGVHIDPTEWNRNDGFSPSSILMTHVDDLDAVASHLPPVTDIASSLDRRSPLTLVDLTTRRRTAAWAELDANASDDAHRMLMIVPASSLLEGHRYGVDLGSLRRTDGSPVPRSRELGRRLRAKDPATVALVDALAAQGARRAGIQVAWSFTVGSGDSISGRLRSMWAETSKAVGDGAPPFSVSKVTTNGGVKVVEGTFEMPRYLTGDGGPGTVLNNGDDPDGRPTRRGTMRNAFTCTVPAKADGDHLASSVLYGHGLLGSRAEVLGIGSLAAGAGIAMCALDWLGMSTADIGPLVQAFDELTAFRTVPDRLQQGELGFLLLGRLLHSSKGFVTDEAFQGSDGSPALDTEKVSFLGASQGGILGGVPSALATDWDRAVLAVPGIGYNLLLRRSIDFDEFAPPVEKAYPDELAQPLLLDLLEQLWQRGENSGYAQHLTAHPYPGVRAKEVLLLQAFGDHQVANVSTEKLARTLGIGRRTPTLAAGRSTDREPFFGIPTIGSLPSGGSGLVVWDFGTTAPPTTNTANRAGEDPHGKLADVPEALALVVSFVAPDGQLIDVCEGKPCRSTG